MTGHVTLPTNEIQIQNAEITEAGMKMSAARFRCALPYWRLRKTLAETAQLAIPK